MTQLEVNGKIVRISDTVIKIGDATITITGKGFSVEDAAGGVESYLSNGYKFETAQPYFFMMSVIQREEVKKWFESFKPITNRQKIFYEVLKKAVEKINYDFHIANIEPSIDENGNIYFNENHDVARRLSPIIWRNKAKDFFDNEKWYSDLATLYELTLWYAYRLAKQYWSITYVCDNSSSAGNFMDSPNAYHTMVKTGKIKVGGFCDGIGNTFRLVRHGRNYIRVGSYFKNSGRYNQVFKMTVYSRPTVDDEYGAGVIVLKRYND